MNLRKLTLYFIISCIWNIVLANTAGNHDETTKSTLKMTLIVFRHGDRTPAYTFPGDPYANYSWPGGLSALTMKGSSQMYNLGKKLRERYIELLPEDGLYMNKILTAFSSNTERTIMSAQSLLASFMIPSKNINLLPIDWQPIPVYAIPTEKDLLIAGSRMCLKYNECLLNVTSKPPKDYIEMFKEIMPIREFAAYLKKNLQLKDITVLNLIQIYDTLEIEENYNLTMPDWYKPINAKLMRKIIERTYEMFTENIIMKRIRAGPLLTNIAYLMEHKINQTELKIDQKIVFYSGHDITLSALIRALEIDNQTTVKPEYGSTLIFELHDNPSIQGHHEVKLFFYENSECEKPEQIKIPFCPEPCSFDTFNEYLIRNYVGKYEFYCTKSVKIQSGFEHFK